ncbi:Major Facilitator Superfamily transporter [Halosimplex carlsbadense 2-9-1]|uniref:Major Facilitator Superfamily transporter n=1 Tax=Halosimplex carlsbadense 2-9-1 TaxID=797114 RepID=M0CP86_9EURY|nr:Major Facilitator Superfamily transporter [Halosimplex carlsbadense 2-9-1]
MRVDLSNPRALIRRYYLFQALAAVGFVSPIFALFVLRDLTYPQYGTLSAVYSLVLVAGEIPTGYVGDRVGRRDTLVASKVTMAASLLGFLAVDSFASYLAVYVLWAVGIALSSGTGGAWLYEVLESTVGEEQFTTVRGRGQSIARWSSAVTTLLGAVLYGVDPSAPFLAAGGLMLVSAAVIATLPRTEQFEAGETAGPSVREAVPLLRDRIARPPLRSFVAFAALLFGVVGAGNQYVQPIAVAVAEGADLAALPVVGAVAAVGRASLPVDIPVTAATGLGPLYASFALVAGAVSYYAGPIEARFGLSRVLGAAAVVLVVGTLLPLAVPLAAFATFYLLRAVHYLLRPMVENHVNGHVDDVGRATVLSAVSMVFGLARTPFVVLAGVAAGARGPVAAYGTLGVMLFVAAVPLAVLGSPFPNEASGATGAGTADG